MSEFIAEYISDEIEKIRTDLHTGTLLKYDKSTQPLDFFYAYGPYMVMSDEFAEAADAFSQWNDVMKFLKVAAYIIRGSKLQENRALKSKFFNDMMQSIHTMFTEDHKRYHDSLIKLVQLVKASDATENFITASAPIVPYSEVMKKQTIHDAVTEDILPANPTEEDYANAYDAKMDISASVEKMLSEYLGSNDELRRDYLDQMLANNLYEILIGARDLTIVPIDQETKQISINKFDKLIMKNGHSVFANAYFFISTAVVLRIPFESFKAHLKFFKQMGDFNKPLSYDAFESLVNNTAVMTSTDISLESWENHDLALEAADATQSIIDDIMSKNDAVSSSVTNPDNPNKWDLNVILNYIALHKYMKFDHATTQFFSSTIEGVRITNVNTLQGLLGVSTGTIIFYELANGYLVVPFTDTKDWSIKILALKENTDTPFEIKSLDELNK